MSSVIQPHNSPKPIRSCTIFRIMDLLKLLKLPEDIKQILITFLGLECKRIIYQISHRTFCEFKLNIYGTHMYHIIIHQLIPQDKFWGKLEVWDNRPHSFNNLTIKLVGRKNTYKQLVMKINTFKPIEFVLCSFNNIQKIKNKKLLDVKYTDFINECRQICQEIQYMCLHNISIPHELIN